MALTGKMDNGLVLGTAFSCFLCLISYVMSSTLPLTTSSEQLTTVKPSQFYSCLQNCANCVQFWEYGLYNGRRCAKRCLRQQGREIVDPDCNNPKMFNYSPRIIDLLLESQRNQQPQQQQQDEADDDEMLSDQPYQSNTHQKAKGHNGKHGRHNRHQRQKGGKNKAAPNLPKSIANRLK
ncbi:hypothetical protein CHUAL_013058 [Chamberlinius hualienensis]